MADPIDPFGGLEGADRDAFAAIQNTLKAFGLETLAPKVLGFIQQGYSTDTISILLPETPEYKQRFKANDARRAAGLPVLSPAEYLSVEDSYRQIMASAGLPPRFYDQADDFTSWIAGDVAPVEVQERVHVAQEMLYSTDPAALDEFRQAYSDGDMIAYALDRERATQVLSQQWSAAQVRSTGAAQGLSVSVPEAERIGSLGLNQSQLRAGVGQAAAISQSARRLSTVYGGDYTAQDALDETFFSDSNALRKRTRLASQERASFSGSSGVNQKSLTARKGGQL